jgi:hypothetical protein
MINWFKNLYYKIKMEIRYRKRLKEMKKRDPFIYK